MNVAPYAGAWIEIFACLYTAHGRIVAPYAGAWIEIRSAAKSIVPSLVAPYAGAWIEMILIRLEQLRTAVSLPTRERGLKCCSRSFIFLVLKSLPTRERGLKS